MKDKHTKKALRSKALLTGLNASGEIVYRTHLDLDKYYDGSPKVMDSADFRREKGIRMVFGALYGLEGRLLQAFLICCGQDGSYLHNIAKHADGTVTSD